jgi:hypothetical protein
MAWFLNAGNTRQVHLHRPLNPPGPATHPFLAFSYVAQMSESPSLLDPGAAFNTLSLPTLPTIKSRQIRAQVFAHNSLATGHRDKFQASPSDLGSHNER